MKLFLLLFTVLFLSACKSEKSEDIYQISDADGYVFLLNTRTGDSWRLVASHGDDGTMYETYWSKMDRADTPIEIYEKVQSVERYNQSLKAQNEPKR